MTGWLTTKLLGYVCAALLVLLGVQTWRLDSAQEARDAALVESGNAIGANQTNNAMIAALVAEREGLLATRAAEKAAADRAVSDSQQREVILIRTLNAAKGRINELSQRPTCIKVMDAPICPEIVQELRAP